MLRYLLVLLSSAAILGCTAIQQQKSRGPSTTPAPAASHFKNLQVLPPDITLEVLRETMRGYARALGVHCDHCHAEGTDGHPDFPSDTKREKNMGRFMIRMARAINHDYLLKVTEKQESITCWTCHRGHAIPEAPPPPPPAETR